MTTRAERRDRAIRKGRQRREDHLKRNHPNGVVDCICELSVWRFAKRKGIGCESCRGRRHGNPKIGGGLCSGEWRWRPSVAERIAGKRLARAWLSSADVEHEDL